MVEPEDICIIILVIVKLGVVVGFHELCAAELVHHGWDPGDRHRKVVRPCLDRALDS